MVIQAVKIVDSTQISRVSSVSHKVEDTLFFLKESSDELFELNHTASFVWEALEKPITFNKLTDLMLKEFDVDRKVLEKDLVKLLDLLQKKDVIVIS